jgi:protein arginine kinase activator
MKCDVCKAEATVFLTQIINGQMTTVNLCEACSQAKGVTNELGFGLSDAFLGSSKTVPIFKTDVLTCPACGFTSAQFKKIGRMGCPACYDTFRQGLDSLLASMHKGTQHVGKVPSNIAPILAPSVALDDLRTALGMAIAEERYEDAAQIKKQIEAIQSPAPVQA